MSWSPICAPLLVRRQEHDYDQADRVLEIPWPLFAPGRHITGFGKDAQREVNPLTIKGSLFRVVPY